MKLELNIQLDWVSGSPAGSRNGTKKGIWIRASEQPIHTFLTFYDSGLYPGILVKSMLSRVSSFKYRLPYSR